jgi:Protein of unknown function (DUF3455)
MAAMIRRKIQPSCVVLGLIFGAALAHVWASAQEVPAPIKLPEGQALVAEAHAKGFQVYTCKNDGGKYAWTLKGPDAELFDKAGKAVGRHFAGPTWEWSDKSQVIGKMLKSAPSPDADSIPWLLLEGTGHSGEGVLSKVTNIQRLNTKGGKAPAGGCDAAHEGQETREAYTADYFFYGK